MKSRQFPSFDEAIAYLESKGELKYWGRVGIRAEICYYTLTIGRVKYMLYVHEDGKVEIRE